MSGYRHGVYVSEIPTSIVPPVEALAGLPVVVGTAFTLQKIQRLMNLYYVIPIKKQLKLLGIVMTLKTIHYVSL